MHCVSTLQMLVFVICEHCGLCIILCSALCTVHWCSNWGRRILTICEHCELCTKVCAISTTYYSPYFCTLCSNWGTVHCALCTVHCVQCTVLILVHCAQTGAGGVGGLGARQASRSSSGKGKWTNLFGTQTISPPPLILRLRTKFTQLLIIQCFGAILNITQIE